MNAKWKAIMATASFAGNFSLLVIFAFVYFAPEKKAIIACNLFGEADLELLLLSIILVCSAALLRNLMQETDEK